MWKHYSFSSVFRRTLFVVGLAAVQPAGLNAKVAVTTYHNDNFRTGWNSGETTLSAASFPANFGVLNTVTLDANIETQPLLVPGLLFPNGTTHDVVYVETQNNTVYAIDASTGVILINPPTPGGVNYGYGGVVLGTSVLQPTGDSWGIRGTPVIDPVSQTLFVIALVNLTPTSSTVTPAYQLHALSLTTLTEKAGSPVTITASHTLTDGSTYSFAALYTRHRPGLLLQNGNVYAGFGSNADYNSDLSRGWLLGWNETTLAPLVNHLTDTETASADAPISPPDFLTAIWMSGYGVAGDGTATTAGDVYFSTGNSDCKIDSGGICPPATTWTPITHNQESVVEVSGDLTTTHSVFTPGSAPSTLAMDASNDDLSAGGVLVLPPQNLGGNYFAVAAGKDGRLFLFERKGTADLQWIHTYTNGNLSDGCWCGPSYFMGSDGISRVVTSHGNVVQVYTVTVSPPALTLVGTSATTVGLGGQQDPGFFTTVSSNGTTAGSAIIWAVSRPDGSIPSNPTAVKLYAFSATPSCTGTTCTYPQLYSGVAGAWPFANNNSNIVPVVANGQVYVASDYFDASGTLRGQLNIFGIPAAAHAALAAAPATEAALTKQAAKPLEGRQIPPPNSPHSITGKLVAANGSTLTLQTREHKSRTVDASQAMKKGLFGGGPLKVGTPYNAVGSTIEGNGALLADRITRARGDGVLWPPDKD
jgi:hypothetical protein